MFDFSREEQGSKAVTPKIVFKRPGSRESNGNFPGLVRVTFFVMS